MAKNHEIRISAGRSDQQYWSDLWRFRELFYFLAWRDLLVRYKQTAIGIAWAVIRPLLTMLAFTVVFGKLAQLPSGGVPYPILVFAGLLPWQLFASAFAEVGNSLIGNATLISKVYFPRLVIPISAAIVSLVDFAISLLILVALMAWYGFVPGWQILTLPLFTFLAVVTALSIGVWMAALNVKYRDVRIVVPFVVQIGLYVSPVGFSSAIVPPEWRLLYGLNPMVGVIDGFRWAITGGKATIHIPSLAVSLVLVALLAGTGLLYFRRTEKTFADTI